MRLIDTLIRQLEEHDGTDLHLVAGNVPKYRVRGELVPISEHTLGVEDVLSTTKEIVTKAQWNRLQSTGVLDIAYTTPDGLRVRGHFFRHHRGPGAIFRRIDKRIPTLAELGLPPVVGKLVNLERGLLLITGPSGSGKSTTAASLIDAMNSRLERHIVTVEDPIEYVHQDNHCVVVQREVGRHVQCFATAVGDAILLGPDVIFIGDIQTPETMIAALDAARKGYFVLATLHTSGSCRALDRIFELFPSEAQPMVRVALADHLKAVVSQILVGQRAHDNRVAAAEVLLVNRSARTLIREGKTAQLHSLIQRSTAAGMMTLDQSLMEAVRSGKVPAKEAWRRAHDKTLLASMLRP